MRGVPGFWWSLISAVLAIVVGVMLIGWPVRGGLLADLAIALFDSGDEVTVQAGEEGIRFLLLSGKPLREPVAWYGPIVMNTQAELRQAAGELRDGTFIRSG